jgi:aryl-alcohol dehydrogenase-like predicted oxidoreductase
MNSVQLGLGLIGIGKVWGHVPGEVPPEGEVQTLLAAAVEMGIRYFDTAASYGVSEERLGAFLRSLDTATRASLTIATKFGEHWDAGRGEPFVDHRCDALCRSLDRSVTRLGRIDILQLHKTTPEVLASDDLARAWEYAESLGIRRYGPSVSDVQSAAVALREPRYTVMQLPFNRSSERFATTVEAAGARGIWLATNRPFTMGAMLYEEGSPSKTDAFAYILRHRFHGAVLTGTRVVEHLRENLAAFREAQARVRA